MKNRLYRAIVFLLICCLHLGARGERIYTEQTGDQTTTHTFIIKDKNPAGFLVNLETRTGEHLISQVFDLDARLGTISWSFEDAKENTRITARREDNRIYLQGTARGKAIKKKFKINDLAWNQSFNLGLEKFAQEGSKKIKFWAIGTSGPGYMKITKFSVKRKKVKEITIMGQQTAAHHIQISLSGLLSMFWTGNYWYRQSDGLFLRYKGKNKPGAPITTMELQTLNNPEELTGE